MSIMFLPFFDGKVIYDFYHSRHFCAPRRRMVDLTCSRAKVARPLLSSLEFGFPRPENNVSIPASIITRLGIGVAPLRDLLLFFSVRPPQAGQSGRQKQQNFTNFIYAFSKSAYHRYSRPKRNALSLSEGWVGPRNFFLCSSFLSTLVGLVVSQEWSVWYNEFRAADYNGWRNRRERERGEWLRLTDGRRWIRKRNGRFWWNKILWMQWE